MFIKKIVNCPSINYLQKYPLKYVYDETSNNNQYSDFENFVENNINKEVLFKVVEKTFCEATPTYVAGKINSVLQSGVIKE